MSLGWELVRALLAFAAVAGLAYATARLLGGRWRYRSAGRRLEVVEAVAVGPRRLVCLLRVGEDVLCVGMGEGGVAVLARYRGDRARRLLQLREGEDLG